MRSASKGNEENKEIEKIDGEVIESKNDSIIDLDDIEEVVIDIKEDKSMTEDKEEDINNFNSEYIEISNNHTEEVIESRLNEQEQRTGMTEASRYMESKALEQVGEVIVVDDNINNYTEETLDTVREMYESIGVDEDKIDELAGKHEEIEEAETETLEEHARKVMERKQKEEAEAKRIKNKKIKKIATIAGISVVGVTCLALIVFKGKDMTKMISTQLTSVKDDNVDGEMKDKITNVEEIAANKKDNYAEELKTYSIPESNLSVTKTEFEDAYSLERANGASEEVAYETVVEKYLKQESVEKVNTSVGSLSKQSTDFINSQVETKASVVVDPSQLTPKVNGGGKVEVEKPAIEN